MSEAPAVADPLRSTAPPKEKRPAGRHARLAGHLFVVALVAELFETESGLGFLMLRAQTLSDAATVFAACFAVVLLFIAGEKLIIDPLSRKYRYR